MYSTKQPITSPTEAKPQASRPVWLATASRLERTPEERARVRRARAAGGTPSPSQPIIGPPPARTLPPGSQRKAPRWWVSLISRTSSRSEAFPPDRSARDALEAPRHAQARRETWWLQRRCGRPRRHRSPRHPPHGRGRAAVRPASSDRRRAGRGPRHHRRPRRPRRAAVRRPSARTRARRASGPTGSWVSRRHRRARGARGRTRSTARGRPRESAGRRASPRPRRGRPCPAR